MEEYTSEIQIWFGGNNHEAKSEEDYIKKVKDQFWEDFGIKLTNAEITNIQKRQKGGAEAGFVAQLLFCPVTEQLFVFNESQVRRVPAGKKNKKRY